MNKQQISFWIVVAVLMMATTLQGQSNLWTTAAFIVAVCQTIVGLEERLRGGDGR